MKQPQKILWAAGLGFVRWEKCQGQNLGFWGEGRAAPRWSRLGRRFIPGHQTRSRAPGVQIPPPGIDPAAPNPRENQTRDGSCGIPEGFLRDKPSPISPQELGASPRAAPQKRHQNCPKSPQNSPKIGSKTAPKLPQNRSKTAPNWPQNQPQIRGVCVISGLKPSQGWGIPQNPKSWRQGKKNPNPIKQSWSSPGVWNSQLQP